MDGGPEDQYRARREQTGTPAAVLTDPSGVFTLARVFLRVFACIPGADVNSQV